MRSLHRTNPTLAIPDIPALANAMPTNAKAETIPRAFGITSGSQTAALTSGTLLCTAIPLKAGMSLATISFLSGAVALATGSNQWFAITNKAMLVLGKTADDTSTAWGANTVKTLTITGGPIVIPTTDYHFLCCLVVATTVPALVGPTNNLAAGRVSPFLCGNSNAGLTNPASLGASANALAASGTPGVYGFVS